MVINVLLFILLAAFGTGASEQMLGLPVEILFGLTLGTPVASDPSTEIVVLAEGTHPASIGEREVLIDRLLLLH